MTTKHVKPKSRYQQGGIVHQESAINSAKVMLVCSSCGKPTRVGKKVYENGSKERTCKKCGTTIDIIKEVKQ